MGAGNLGLALADYPGFRDEGFEIAALFDATRDKIGKASRSGVPIYDIRELRTVARRAQITIAVVAVPGELPTDLPRRSSIESIPDSVSEMIEKPLF